MCIRDRGLYECDIIVLTSGGIPETSDRLDELKTNKKVVSQYTKRIVDSGFKGIFIVVSNPCDIMAYLVKKVSGFESSRVIGAGTALDSSRANSLLSKITGISAKSINAIVMGEHGESQFIPWSQVKIAGLSFYDYKNKYKDQFINFNEDDFEDQVRKRGWEIYLGKSSTQYGIANTINAIISAIVHDENKVINVSAMLNGQYGLDDLYISTPCLINKNGIEKIFELPLEACELKKLNKAAELIKSYNKALV